MDSNTSLCGSYVSENDEADDDEFLYGSIQRCSISLYDTLQMFTLENVPFHVLQSDDTSLCVASNRSKRQGSEVLKLKIPEKLMLPAEDEGRSKDKDFKMLSGIYTDNEVYEIDHHKGKIITSENNVTGLNIYTFSDSALANSNVHEKLNVTPWEQPEFTVIQESGHAVCSKCFHKPLVMVDLSTGEVVKEFKHYFENYSKLSNHPQEKAVDDCINRLRCCALSNDLIAVLNTYSGEVVLHDLRTEHSFTPLPGSTEKVSEEIWALSGSDYKEATSNYFGIVSNATSFCIYDKRKPSILTQNAGDSVPAGDYMTLRFNKEDKFSISGADSFVQIFKLNGTNFEHIFTHTGHTPGRKSLDLVTDHIWLHAGGKEYIVSICSNSTLNCWDFKV